MIYEETKKLQDKLNLKELEIQNLETNDKSQIISNNIAHKLQTTGNISLICRKSI